MNNGIIIHLDNDYDGILVPSKNLFDEYNFDFEYIVCKNKSEFDETLEKHKYNVKALIFDLLSKEPSSKEFQQKDAEFLENLRSSFSKYNVPIFIYSGYLEALEGEFEKFGTVTKFDKGGGIGPIFEKLKLYVESGFIDVFCSGGIIENEIREELHNAFINQFSESSQIESVINSIMSSTDSLESKSARVKSVFKRIIIKTLASDLLAPVADSEDKVNPIEHFYKRTSKLKVWTGDIWTKKANDDNVLVLTPRCDFATGKANTIIYCIIENQPEIDLKDKPHNIEKKIRDFLTDNIPGKSKRYIPSTVFFSGGMVNLASHHTISKDQFLLEYDYIITLSDDLTNEIIGKFAYYFLRTGITNINESEFEAIVKSLSSTNGQK